MILLKPEKNMIDHIRQFNRQVSLERFKSHSTNQNIEISELADMGSLGENSWRCGILWGNADVKGLIIVRFTTLNILAMSSDVFENTKDNLLFEYTKDFMKEYCNFYAGFIKGTFNNQDIDISLSLPIISNSLSAKACLGGLDDKTDVDKWALKSSNSFFEVESYVKVQDGLKKYDLSFLTKNDKKNETQKNSSATSNIEFF